MRVTKWFGAGCAIAALIAPVWAGSPAGKPAEPKPGIAKEDLVALALRAEARGDAAARKELLDEALQAAPDDANVRWQTGHVWHDDAWLKPDQIVAALAEDRRLVEYRNIRDDYPDTVAGQLELAQWCARKGLHDQQRAHLTKVLELNPNHVEARRELGFRWVDGVWLSAEERVAAAKRSEQAGQSLDEWSPKLIRLRDAMERRSQRQRGIAIERLMEIKESQAIPALEAVFAAHSELTALLLVDVLAGIDGIDAATALARQAVFSPSEVVRSSAAKKLHARPFAQFVPVLLSSMFTPLQSRYELYTTPGGRIFYEHSFYREGQDERQQQTFQVNYSRRRDDGAVVLSQLVAAQKRFAALAEERERQAAEQEAYNAQLTERVSMVLAMATEQPLLETPEAWWDWWNARNEITYLSEKPLKEDYQQSNIEIVDGSPVTAQPVSTTFVPTGTNQGECLAAGTPIWTDLGNVAVEKIQAGDRVLSQNPETGELVYKPVLRTTVRPSGKLLSIDAGSAGKLDCSGGHVFWVDGQGWMRARTLEPGMMIHTLDGPVELSEVREGPEAETYNLIVADFHSYFTAEGMWLSHDFTPQSATSAIVPGLVAAR